MMEETKRVVWTGEWVAERLGVSLNGGDELPELLGLALRRNPKRAHLLVSNVLGKHVPQRPGAVHGAGFGLGRRVRELLGEEAAARSVVLGYAETATGLGHSVADGLALAPYLHSTRRPVAGVEPVGGFEEEHSHATSHLLLPEDPALLAGDGPLVLVDDEFSTGRTVLNTIKSLHARFPRERYVVVALVDMRSDEDRSRLEKFAAELGARVDLVALAAGGVRLPVDVLERGQELVAAHEAGAAQGAGASGAATANGSASAPGERAAADVAAALGRRAPASRAVRVDLAWPAGLPDGGRHGFTPAHRERLEAALPAMGARLAAELDGARRILVLGNEELMYAPLRIAEALDARVGGDAAGVRPRAGADGTAEVAETPSGGASVFFSTTTRSPVLAVDDPGYAIRTRLSFPAHDRPADGPGERYAYNVAAGADQDRGFDAIVAVVDSCGDGPELHTTGGLLDRLAEHTDRLLLAVIPSYAPRTTSPSGPLRGTVGAADPADPADPTETPATSGSAETAARETSAPHPTSAPRPPRRQAPSMPLPEPLRGPAFSSYAPEEVGWLLQDLSDVTLEAPTEEREEAIQRGGAHYAESLPVEYQPSEQYQALFHSALGTSARRIARAVGAVTDTVLAERQRPEAPRARPVLVSLARAGTPVGVLMRRWAQHAHGLDLPHYAVSIVRGRGIDTTALRWLAAHHDPADIVFVDGWTGKGAITRELAQALEDFPGFDPRIAVLADPGGCVETYGTRDDFLIPSACLNSTVSGLISRTVLRDDLVGPDDFHGAKFYRELAGTDVSRDFLDAIGAHFDDVAEEVAADVRELAAADRAPTWAGWAAVERISAAHGINDVNLVKPGVGETTRVLLRRVPWKILAKRGAGADLDHVRLLAEQRGVPVEEVDELPYSCVGLIHPRFTRGATGADGKAVASS
ncbi:phosphoribosyltransferase [Streptomyces sp. NPDC017993]|uniref:phosphoribosyltransferase n=1 Tax=Streptomyces sp. NPDC017993 TaxID=3365027 RepID=UPI0037B3B171